MKPEEIEIRPLIRGDCAPLAKAFAAIGWAASKPESQFERYLAEQAADVRATFVACTDRELAGYVTLLWQPTYAPLREAGVPEIQDLNVLPAFRRRGIATRLVDAAEALAATRVDEVGIGVGLHPGYNAAQRMYVLRGYVPDARGVTTGERFVREGEPVAFDDDLVLHFTKRLHRSRAELARR